MRTNSVHRPNNHKSNIMSTEKNKKAQGKAKRNLSKGNAPALTFNVISNTRTHGRAPSNDRFTLSTNNLLLNVQTRRNLNIPVPAYVEFCKANQEGYEKTVFLRFRKTRRSEKCMKVGKLSSKYYHIGVPTSAAKEVGMVFKAEGARGKRKRSIVHYKGEPMKLGRKKRMLMLTPIEG